MPAPSTLPTIELLRTRRSVPPRNLVEPGPDRDQLQQILEAGLRVPDHGKLGPWRVQILEKPAQLRLGAHFAEWFAADHPDARPEQIEVERNRPSLAPLLLVVVSKRVKGHKIPEFEQLLSGGAMCQNLLLASHALGFAANWITGWAAYDPRLKPVLGHAPDDEILGFIYIGTPNLVPDERPRKSVEDIVEFWTGD